MGARELGGVSQPVWVKFQSGEAKRAFMQGVLAGKGGERGEAGGGFSQTVLPAREGGRERER